MFARFDNPKTMVSVTPSNDVLFDPPIALYVGTGGTLVVAPAIQTGSSVFTFENVPDAFILPCLVSRVMLATTATDIVGMR